MQEAEIDAVPLPLHAGKAGAHAGDADSVGRVRDRHRIRAAHGLEPAGVVVVAVAEDRRVQPPYAQRAQRRYADALERKSVVQGKSVSVRVDPGGPRIFKTKI